MSGCLLSLSKQPSVAECEEMFSEKVSMALRNSGYVQLQDLNVRVDHQGVHLQGRLPSYYLKQLAHQVVLSMPEVRTLIDDIDVVN